MSLQLSLTEQSQCEQYLVPILVLFFQLSLEGSLQAGSDASILVQRAIPQQTAITKQAVALGSPTKGWCSRGAVPETNSSHLNLKVIYLS